MTANTSITLPRFPGRYVRSLLSFAAEGIPEIYQIFMKHIFGPVISRRLGHSLGIDLLADKICNLNCIYCEVGPTVKLTCERDFYVDPELIIAEIRQFCENPDSLKQVDVVTVTASGEPTLHSSLEQILAFLKEVTGKKVVVLTNGTTLSDQDVRRALRLADLVIPSLDSVLPRSFKKLNRPANCLDLNEIVEGIISFSREYPGELWLEILFVLGINDSEEDLQALLAVLLQILPDRIQLNTVARPPLEKYALPVSLETLKTVAELFSRAMPTVPVDILAGSGGAVEPVDSGQEEEMSLVSCPESGVLEKIVSMLKRRPCTAADINRIFQFGGSDKVEQYLEPLVRSGELELRSHGDKYYYH